MSVEHPFASGMSTHNESIDSNVMDEEMTLNRSVCLKTWSLVRPVAILCTILVGFGSGETRRSNADDQNSQQLGSAGEMSRASVINCAFQALGGIVDKNKLVADEIQVPGRLIPFVGPDGQKVWRVDADPIAISVQRGGRVVKNPDIAFARVLVSPDSEQVLQIVCQRGSGQPFSATFPSATSYERQMNRVRQVFTGLPNQPPKVTFAEALQRAEGVQNAKEIVAYYVTSKYLDFEESHRPVWVIHAWGIPPMKLPAPPGAPSTTLTHIRTIIDAETGEPQLFDSIPQPEP